MRTSRKYLLNVGDVKSYGIGSRHNYTQYSLLDSFSTNPNVPPTTTTTTVAPKP